MMRMFRVLTAAEIECRLAEVDKEGRGVTLLLYKTARTDAALLDEIVGHANWQNDFKLIDGTLYGGIGIKMDGEWIWRWDCGKESNVEAEKGEASDAFKRAGFKWGIGTELYTAPRIFVPSEACRIAERGGRLRCYDTFCVEKIAYSDAGEITGIAIYNESIKKRCFVWQRKQK